MINPTENSGGLAASAQSLDKLRMQAKQSPDQALKAVAQQFETVFMNMMLKSMRDATPQDGMFDSEQTKMFTGMLDQQLAQNMSSRGVGLADAMVKQLSRTLTPGAATALPESSHTVHPSRAAALPSAYGENFAHGAKNSPSPQTPLQQDFVRRLTPSALQASRETGMPAQLMLGQAALETGWGQREIRLPDGGNSYNLFGVKAGGNWSGKVAEVTTTEYHNGVPSKQVEKFRAYGSYAEAFSDYAHLLRDHPRYAGVIQQGQGVEVAAHALQSAGYATDPNYADKLVKVMNRISAIG